MNRLGVWAQRLKRLVLGFVALLLLYQLWLFGWVLWWNWVNPDTTRFMNIRLDELRVKDPQARLQKQWVDYEKISVHLKHALVAAEDAKFVDHEGFDWEGIQHALEKNQKKGRVVAGGSTISQQLAKNLFLTPSKTPWRKAQEAIITPVSYTHLDVYKRQVRTFARRAQSVPGSGRLAAVARLVAGAAFPLPGCLARLPG